MIGLVGLAAGGLLEIKRLRNKAGNNDAQAQELRKAVKEYAKDLEQERRNASAANRRADSLESRAAQLAAQNAELLASNLHLGDSADKLRDEVSALTLVNTCLSGQVRELSAARDADAARFEADVSALRDRVAGVLQRLFSNEIDEPAAVDALRELGCEVQFVPAGERRRGGGAPPAGEAAATFTIEPRLLLDDPARMARLMQAARGQSGGASPRLLEASGSSGTSGSGKGGSRTPRGLMHGSIAGSPQQPPLSMLTIGGNGTASGTAPSFVLSWLGGGGNNGASAGGADGAASGNAAGVANSGGDAQDAVRAQPKDASPPKRKAVAAPAPAKGASAPAGSPSKSRPVPVQIQQQGDNVVISKQGKNKGPKSRLGLSLTDASSVFRRGGGAAADDAFDELPGAGDVGGSRDLALR